MSRVGPLAAREHGVVRGTARRQRARVGAVPLDPAPRRLVERVVHVQPAGGRGTRRGRGRQLRQAVPGRLPGVRARAARELGGERGGVAVLREAAVPVRPPGGVVGVPRVFEGATPGAGLLEVACLLLGHPRGGRGGVVGGGGVGAYPDARGDMPNVASVGRDEERRGGSDGVELHHCVSTV